jgi:hypothetical protein
MDVCDGDDVLMDGLCMVVHALWIIPRATVMYISRDHFR